MFQEKDGTVDELKQALVENLEHSGVLNKIRAEVRAEVYHLLEGGEDDMPHPPLCNDNLLMNELIRDYLKYNGYSNALNVFLAESGQPNDKALSRPFLRDELGLTELKDHGSQGRLPLLYGVIHALRRWKEESLKGGEDSEGRRDGTHTKTGPHRVAVSREDDYMINNASSAHGATCGRFGGSMGEAQANFDNTNPASPAPILLTKPTGGGGSIQEH